MKENPSTHERELSREKKSQGSKIIFDGKTWRPKVEPSQWGTDCSLSAILQSTLEGHSSSVEALIVLRDGRLVSGAGDKMIKVWDMNAGKCSHTL